MFFLSQSRADSIQSVLVASGIDGEKLETVALGDKQPVKKEIKDSGQPLNRRVSFQIK